MKETEYKLIQIEDQCETIIGEITMQKDNFIKAELFTSTIGCIDDLQEARRFLDGVESKMKESNNTKHLFQ